MNRLVILVVIAIAVAVPAIAVAAAKGSGPPPKVVICHQGATLSVPPANVDAHIAHGDHVGKCVAPVPDGAHGVAIDPGKGYFVEEI